MKKQIKIAWFTSGTPKAVVIAKNGKSLDNYSISCTTEEDLEDGSYLLDAEFTNYCEFLKEEDILKVLEDYGEEYFKISKVTTSINRVSVVARQITIPHELTLWLDDARPTNLNGQGACTWLLDKATGTKEIDISSDISATNSATYIKKSLYEALHSADNSFINRWGGEVLRRGYTVYINQHIGINRGFAIRYGKNLTGFECESNIDELVTRAIGKGYDGIQGDYIDSPHINDYERVYTKEFEYSDVRVNDENYSDGFDTLEEAQAELNRRINAEFSGNKIDTIKASFNINFAVLSKTEQYKDCALVEKAYIGDTIRVYIKKLNVDITVRLVCKKFDVLAQKVIETKLSNYILPKPLTINQIIKKLEEVPTAENVLSLAKDTATVLIKAGMKNSYVVVKQNEILIMNTQDINTATKIWRWNNGGLGYSSTGYNGQYGTAITQDGKIVADFITTGILNAGLVKAGVLESFNGKSWLNMEDGTFNFSDRLSFDGTIFKIDAKNFKTDKDGNVTFTGKIQPDSCQLDLFGTNCRIDGSADALRLQLTPEIYVSIDSQGFMRIYNQYQGADGNYLSLGYENDNHASIYNKTTRLKLLGGDTAQVQARNAGDNAYVAVGASDFINTSSKKYKTNISAVNINDLMKILKTNNIKTYNLKADVFKVIESLGLEDTVSVDEIESSSADKKIGLVTEEITDDARDILVPEGSEGVSIYNMVSILWAIVQQQETRIEALEEDNK